MIRARTLTALTLTLSLALLAGCSGGGGSSGPASVGGTIDFQAAGTTAPLTAGTGSLDASQRLGLVHAGSRFAFHTEDDDALHALDFVARETLHVRASLRGAGELALGAFDPVELGWRASASSNAASRANASAGVCELEFDARGSFDLVLRGQGTLSLAFSAAPASARGVRGASPCDVAATRALFAGYEAPHLECARGELIVAPRAGVASAALLAERGLAQALRIPDGPILARFDLPQSLDERAARLETLRRVRALAEDERVEYAEANLVRRACGGPPNDTYYGLQWDLPLMHVPEAWGITTGSSSVIVAVIDTGETNHPDLVARQIAGYDFISSATNAADGDGVDPDPTDEGDGNGIEPNSFHGTHVAGTIGASTDNNAGVAGITWATDLMHLRVLGKDGGTDFDIANAIKYAARLANVSGALPATRANVINMSLGGPGSSSTVQSAVTAARNAGVVIFAASGNENSSTPFYPAAYSGVISVAAVDLNAQRAPYSNYGPSVDLAAPGGDTSVDLDHDGYADGVLSTLMQGTTPPFTPVYAFYQGTSMACPHAAGVAALMLAVNPALTPAQIETILTGTATDLGAPGRDNFYGYGLVNALAAVSEAGGTSPGTPVLGVTPLSLSFGTSTSSLSSLVTNLGGGALDVGSLLVTMNGGGSWLSAAPVASGSSSSDTASITVDVDRSGLADGDYTGSVQVPSNGGTQTIQVSLSVDSASAPVDVDLYVLLVDSTSFDTVAQVVVNPTTGLDYVLSDLPAGDYILVCGSDDDADNSICGPGDTYCGFYPTLNEPTVIGVAEHETLSGLDFPVSDVTALSGAPTRGFRLLAPRR